MGFSQSTLNPFSRHQRVKAEWEVGGVVTWTRSGWTSSIMRRWSVYQRRTPKRSAVIRAIAAERSQTPAISTFGISASAPRCSRAMAPVPMSAALKVLTPATTFRASGAEAVRGRREAAPSPAFPGGAAVAPAPGEELRQPAGVVHLHVKPRRVVGRADDVPADAVRVHHAGVGALDGRHPVGEARLPERRDRPLVEVVGPPVRVGERRAGPL